MKAKKGMLLTRDKRILIVDDHDHSREGLRQWLLRAGWQAETAADGWQAIKKIMEGAYAVAIVDLDLPPVHGLAMSGWDLVCIFQVLQPGIAIIVLSAESGQDVSARAERLNVSELLEKPISPRQLRALTRTLGG